VNPPVRDRGQAAVEFAIALPLVVMLVFGMVQVTVIVRDQLAIELAARDGARAAAVSATPAAAAAAAAEAATSVRPLSTDTTVGSATVTVTVRHTNRSRLPLLGLVLRDVDLEASVTMAREPP
jgi:Flp pilus assembly protein TadG